MQNVAKTRSGIHAQLLLVAVALALLVGRAAAAPPAHEGPFLDARKTMLCGDVDTCRAISTDYYRERGFDGNPNSPRGTLEMWKSTNAFGKPLADGDDEATAVYYNRGDLDIGRNMNCRSRIVKQPPAEPFTFVTLACYVANYGDGISGHDFFGNSDPGKSIENAKNAGTPIATVVMETTYIKELAFTEPEVWFAVFDKAGKPITEATLDNSQNNQQANQQAVPGICLSCHGGHGGYTGSGFPTPISSNGGRVVVQEAHFLPFDTALYRYGDGTRQTPNAAESESFRKLNAMIRAAYAPYAPQSHVIPDLIDGLYAWCGGVGKAGCAIDPVGHPFVPSADCKPDIPNARRTCGWTTGRPNFPFRKPGFDIAAFYNGVVAPYCRSCHVGAPQRFNVQNFQSWIGRSQNGQPGTAVLVDSVVRQRGLMPFAQTTFNAYFADANAIKLMSQFLDPVQVGTSQRPQCLDRCAKTKAACDAEPNPNRPQCRAEWRQCVAACPPI